MHVDTVPINGQSIHVTDQYKLVGGVECYDNSLGPELHTRYTAVAKCIPAFRKLVTAKAELNITQSVNIADTMMASSLLFNART